MFSSFGGMLLRTNRQFHYFIQDVYMRTEARMSYDRRPTRCMLLERVNAVGRRSADHWAMVGRFVVDKGNR